MTIEYEKYLGYGIVGTPKGRQKSSAGIDKELNLAESFDLSNQYGSALPDPVEDKLATTLYYFTYKEINKLPVLGLAEYRSIKEIGQSRTGSYLGAFIECVNFCFSSTENSIKDLIEFLFYLNKYQIDNFIDQNTLCYKEVIRNVNLPIEESILNQIASNLKQINTAYINPKQEDLYIYIDNNEISSIINTITFILNSEIYFSYRNIYFSSNLSILEKIKEKKGIKIIEYKNLSSINHFIYTYRDSIFKIIEQYKILSKNYQKLDKDKEILIQNAIEKKEQEYLQIINRYKNEISNKEAEISSLNKIKENIISIFNVGNNTIKNLSNSHFITEKDTIMELQREKYISNTEIYKKINEVILKLGQHTTNFENLKVNLDKKIVQLATSKNQNRSITWINILLLGVIFLLFTIGACYLGTLIGDNDKNQKNYSTEFHSLKKELSDEFKSLKEELSSDIKNLLNKSEKKQNEFNEKSFNGPVKMVEERSSNNKKGK